MNSTAAYSSGFSTVRSSSTVVSCSSASEPNVQFGQLSVHVATTVKAIEDLRPAWQAWTRSLETDIDYYLHKLESDTFLRPFVIVVSEGALTRAMLLGSIREHQLSAMVALLNIHGPRGRVLEIPSYGQMGLQSPAVDRLLALQVFEAIKCCDLDLVCFQRLSLQSGLFRELRRLRRSFILQRIPHVFFYCLLNLATAPELPPRALSGKNVREIRRKTRILEHAFPGRARFKCFSGLDEFDEGLRDATRVAVSSWQFYVGCEVLNPPQIRQTVEFLAQQGRLRVYLMYVGNVPVAFLIGYHYHQTFFCQHSGYNSDFSRYSVGSLLTAWALEDLAALGIATVDLGEGGQEHNQRLGCQAEKEGTVHFYSSSFRGFTVNVFFAVTTIIRLAGGRLRSGLRLKWADRLWRQLLRKCHWKPTIGHPL
jgi:Acetyltransferase (GNAT) domain